MWWKYGGRRIQLFPQTVTLTDGSKTVVTSISPLQPHIRLSTDSLNHPLWNPKLRLRRTLQASGQLEKFKTRFQDFSY